MDSNTIIIKPVVSEKSTDQNKLNKYVFRVSSRANKHSIKKAVKEIFNVTAESVNVMWVRGRKKRVRYQYGYTPSWKKAVVTLKKGEKIAIFENQ